VIRILINGKSPEVKVWKFPAGEVGVKVDLDAVPYTTWLNASQVDISLFWEGNDDLMALAQVVDILRHGTPRRRLVLHCPYFPYARQDRRVNEGEAHSLRIVAQQINALKFDRVIVTDPHSTVLEGVLDNMGVIPLHSVYYGDFETDLLIAPDAGAEKKVSLLGQKLNTPVAVCSKTRDVVGAITGINVREVFEHGAKEATVVDDICDGGATFLALAAEVNAEARRREVNPPVLSLYVTHGIFSKGYDELLKAYKNIYVFNKLPIAPAIPACYNSRIHYPNI